MKGLLFSIPLFLFTFVNGNDEPPAADALLDGPIVNDQARPQTPESSEPHEVLYYLSNPWIIAVCTVVAIVLLFNISMICYLQCSPNSGSGRPSFMNKNKRRGYSNVANIDSEDISSSEMEQINID
mmetsp:Transcript_39338/g.34836  ORF Transcript_39338/g.34836 Transcript_39338/m.34836 type:complete len:126 (-) Transcript_39338:131-508(-)